MGREDPNHCTRQHGASQGTNPSSTPATYVFVLRAVFASAVRLYQGSSDHITLSVEQRNPVTLTKATAGFFNKSVTPKAAPAEAP